MPRNTMKKRFSLKDHLFNEDSVGYIAGLFSNADARFDGKKFEHDVMKKLRTLELKERIVWIAEVLEKHLPKDFKTASNLILNALPPALDPTKKDDDFGSFIFAPLGLYVVRNGLSKEHLDISFVLLYELTQRFSMEDAMRAFLNEFPKETLAIYKKWVNDSSYHVRRLVCESTRPYLPWSKRIGIGVQTPLVFLDELYSDNTRYVTRSVANHLNDCTKEDPLYVIETLARWKKEGKQDPSEFAWMTKHALRTLVKKGNVDALELLGYKTDLDVKVTQLVLSSDTLTPGETLTFSFDIVAASDSTVLIDYVIDFVKANGTTKPKVFKIKKAQIKKGESLKISKNHRLLANATTFTLYSGTHSLTLQINGKKYTTAQFIVR